MQPAKERIKRKSDLLERSFELEKQTILNEELETKNTAGLVALDSKIDDLNRSKFESNCKKNLENNEQKHLKSDHFRRSFTKNVRKIFTET